ncbi:MAG: SDR family NAD(P)-dependent oxidoreductase [Armatimonadetes bacterium]|nr:SDR family NAD(P)-dependent oxidoreductase [Armatimonadota bacterium]
MKGKCAIVTGAGGGIGAATARRLASAGAELVLVGRDARALEAVEAQIRVDGGVASHVVADVTRQDEVERAAAHALEEHGAIDLLVNNAGVVAVGNVADFPVEDWDRIFDVNVRGVFLFTRSVLHSMLAQGSGHVINIASVAARVGFPGWAAYSASKAAVAQFSRALLEEVRGHGIRVTVLYPGGVDSPLWDRFPNDFNRGRMLTQSDVAEAVFYAASQPATVLVDEISLVYPLGNQ